MYKSIDMHARLQQRFAQVLTTSSIQGNRDSHDSTGKVGHLLFIQSAGMLN
ncbi:hypothetical protein D3C85_1602190 [compost metagenome]